MLKKKKKINRFIVFIFMFAVLLTAMIVPSFAYGYDEPDTSPVWRDGNNPEAVDIWDYGAVAYNDTDFIMGLSNYFDALYAWGYLPGRLIGVSVVYGDVCNLIFAPNDVQELNITTQTNSTAQELRFYDIPGGSQVIYARLTTDGYYYAYGSYATGSYRNWFSRVTSQGWYREIHNGVPDETWTFVPGTNNSFADSVSVSNNYGDIFLVQFVDFLNENFNPIYTGTIVVNELDIGSIITSYMQAGRVIFDGWFGFEIFGINVASTLISVLVIAIVIWIAKRLRGG